MERNGQRTGLIARKLGMTRIFRADGSQAPATVLRVENCRVVAVRRRASDGYLAVQLGAGDHRASRLTKPTRGHLAKAGAAPTAYLREFRVAAEEFLPPIGTTLSPAHFQAGQFVDVAGVTKGKGFAGSVKRHGFAGGRASHGTSVAHRAHGSTGNHQDPGRVFKNKKMAGHMGSRRRTILNLEVLATDDEAGLIFLHGAVPGAKQSWVLVRDAVKKGLPDAPPFPIPADEGESEPGTEEAARTKSDAQEGAGTEAAALAESGGPSPGFPGGESKS